MLPEASLMESTQLLLIYIYIYIYIKESTQLFQEPFLFISGAFFKTDIKTRERRYFAALFTM